MAAPLRCVDVAHSATSSDPEVKRPCTAVPEPTSSLSRLTASPTTRAAAVLMARVPGRLDWSPVDLGAWLQKLVDMLPAIHNTTVEPADQVQDFQPYRPESWDPPAWLRDRALWDRALAVFHGPPLDKE